MKIRSLLLGSIAAAGLSTSAFAADVPQVLTTLDLCDALGLTGLTISSDNNCLQISGEVKYEFNWGDYKGEADDRRRLLVATTPSRSSTTTSIRPPARVIRTGARRSRPT